ncbi:MAG: alanine racemase [Leptospiraceae bacterium]|nr:alanine racemase [Leptospiraceae bacterium]
MQENKSITRVEISAKAIKKNIQNFRKILPRKTLFASIIKSNAYGHGILEIAKLSLDAKADVLGINSLEEAILLRENFPKAKILIMGEIPHPEKYRKELSDENFLIVVSRTEQIKFYSELSPTPKIHLKVDTGMSRLGSSGEKTFHILENAKVSKYPINGLITHFASTEDFTEHSYSMTQLVRFQKVISFAESLGYKNLINHASSSASTMLFEEARLGMVRVGISLYGLWPSIQTRLSLSLLGKNFELTPVLTWKTGISHIQEIPEGSFVGYGSTFKTNYPTRIAVLPVGYFEGLDRRLSNQGYVLIKGERAPIIGRVCMNMSMVDITHIPQSNIGDEVIIIGRSGKEYISADLHADLTGTINYDVVTRIQKDIPRIVVD